MEFLFPIDKNPIFGWLNNKSSYFIKYLENFRDRVHPISFFAFECTGDTSTSLIIFSFHRDLVAELPFILMHPKPDDDESNPIASDRSPNRLSIDAKSKLVTSASKSGNHDSNANEKDETPNLIQLDG